MSNLPLQSQALEMRSSHPFIASLQGLMVFHLIETPSHDTEKPAQMSKLKQILLSSSLHSSPLVASAPGSGLRAAATISSASAHTVRRAAMRKLYLPYGYPLVGSTRIESEPCSVR